MGNTCKLYSKQSKDLWANTLQDGISPCLILKRKQMELYRNKDTQAENIIFHNSK